MLEWQYVPKTFVVVGIIGVYTPTVEDGSWSTPMVPAQLSVPLQQVEE